MTTKTATVRSAEELARLHIEFFNNRKLEEGAKHATTDCEWVVVPFGETYRGPKGYVECNQNWVNAFPDAKCEISRVIASGNTAVVEFRGKGTHKGTLEGPDGKIKATGKQVDFQICEVYEFKNDKVHRVRTYFDTATLMRQLGLPS